jgi:hypothetical protein
MKATKVRTKCDVAVALCGGISKILIKNGTWIIPPADAHQAG